MKSHETLLALGALAGALAVVAGAFGAHALRPVLSPASLSVWQTGVFYHLVHASLVVAIGLASPSVWLGRASICLLLGCLLFSGSLYALALSGPRWLGPITPVGGVFFILGWLCLALHGLRRTCPEQSE